MGTSPPEPPRFFVPEAPATGLPAPVGPLLAVDLFRLGEESCAITIDGAGVLRAHPASEHRALGAQASRALNVHELAGPLRRLRAHPLWLFTFERVSRSVQVPGLDDPLEASGTLFGPFPSAAPHAWRGHLSTSRAEVLEGLARGAWHPFRFIHPLTGEQSVTSLLLGGEDAAAVDEGRGLILAFPISPLVSFGDAGNDGLVVSLLHEVLLAMRADLEQEGGGRLTAAPLPSPHRAEKQAALEQRGFTVEGDVATRARSGLLGWLFREKVALPPQGSLGDFLELARTVLPEVEGWPTPRAARLRRRVELEAVSWSPRTQQGLTLLESDGAELKDGEVVSPPSTQSPARRPTTPEQRLDASYRCLFFSVDPAFSAHAGPELILEVEFFDEDDTPGANLSSSYDSVEGPTRYKGHASFKGTRTWRRMTLELDLAQLRGRDHLWADFRLQIKSELPLRVRSVLLRRGTAAPAAAAASAAPAAEVEPAPAPLPAAVTAKTEPRAPAPAPARGPAEMVSWPPERWEPLHLASVAVADGRLTIISSGRDPAIQGPPFVFASPAVAVLRLKTNATGLGEVSWQSRQHAQYGGHPAQFPLISDGEFHEYRVRLYEQEELVRVRFDPGQSEGTTELESFHLEPAQVAALPDAPEAARVVYFDPRYTSHWGQAHARLAERLETKGFTLVDADELAAWMQHRTQAGAPGSVCVLAHDSFPDTVFESCRPKLCTATRYLAEGGRIVQGGVFPFSHRALPDGSSGWAGGHDRLVGRYNDVREAPVLTDEGRAWGLTRVGNDGVHVANAREVTVVLARIGKFYAAAWLKTFAPEHPGSGLLRVKNGGLDGANDSEVDELARIAVYALPG